jgi:putative FmdB family regulatory protein
MPIYEFYCEDCHTIFNFYAKKIDTQSRPECPRCHKRRLDRQVSAFAAPKRRGEGGEGGDEKGGGLDDLPIDDARMESAVESLASEAEGMNEDDPRQAAQLMRKFSKMTGLEFNKGMQEALNRMEAGEDPESLEKDMGDLMDGEEPFVLPDKAGKGGRGGRGAPRGAPARDKTLYEM